MEIIEIGAVRLNEQLEVTGTFQSYIKPRYPIQSFALSFCKIERRVLQGSPSFPEVIEQFIDFCGEDYKLIAWGCTDFFSLSTDCRIHGRSTSWLTRMLDMSRFFEGGLAQALTEAEVPFVGQHHSALDDALSAAELLKRKPEIVLSDVYYTPEPFKLVTGGIKKKIINALNRAVQRNEVLTYEQFAADPDVRTYRRIMKLADAEMKMVEELFLKFSSQSYNRKTRAELKTAERPEEKNSLTK